MRLLYSFLAANWPPAQYEHIRLLASGLAGTGLPIGVQVIGPMYGDLTTLRFAQLLEREFGGFVPPRDFSQGWLPFS